MQVTAGNELTKPQPQISGINRYAEVAAKKSATDHTDFADLKEHTKSVPIRGNPWPSV